MSSSRVAEPSKVHSFTATRTMLALCLGSWVVFVIQLHATTQTAAALRKMRSNEGNFDAIQALEDKSAKLDLEAFFLPRPSAATATTTKVAEAAPDTSQQPDALEPRPTTTTVSFFDRAVNEAFSVISNSNTSNKISSSTALRRPKFDVNKWNKKARGGLSKEDRIMLGEIYREASAVFEFGLGESTYIANHVGVPRYAGVDSDPVWVANARSNVADHFRFYFADTGATKRWGYPAQGKLAKNVFQYQVASLQSEPQPFDVYMVDGRWRLPCMLLSFLHASSRGGDPAQTMVLMHDCFKPPKKANDHREIYHQADHMLDLVRHSGGLLCAYKRKPTTADQDLWDLWHLYRDEKA